MLFYLQPVGLHILMVYVTVVCMYGIFIYVIYNDIYVMSSLHNYSLLSCLCHLYILLLIWNMFLTSRNLLFRL